jgi:hypothetical protein
MYVYVSGTPMHHSSERNEDPEEDALPSGRVPAILLYQNRIKTLSEMANGLCVERREDSPGYWED